MNLYNFSIVIFFSIWAFNYFSFKYPKYAYIGLQASIALVITLAQGGGPPVYLDPPLERLGGVIIGIGASYIIANTIWRNHPLAMLKGRLRKLFRLLSYNIEQILSHKHTDVKIHDVTNLFWVCRGLIESLATQNLNHQKQQNYQAFATIFDDLVVLQATLSHIFSSLDREEAHHTASLMGMKLEQFEAKIIHIYHQSTFNDATINQDLRQALETAQMKFKNFTHSECTNLLGYLSSLSELAHKESLNFILKTIKPNQKNKKLSYLKRARAVPNE